MVTFLASENLILYKWSDNKSRWWSICEIKQDLKSFQKSIRKNILKMAYNAGSSSAHIGGALSMC